MLASTSQRNLQARMIKILCKNTTDLQTKCRRKLLTSIVKKKRKKKREIKLVNLDFITIEGTKT